MVGDAAHDGTPKSSQAHFRGTPTTSQISAHEQIRYLMHKQTVEGERNKAPSRGSLIMHRFNFSINRNKKQKAVATATAFILQYLLHADLLGGETHSAVEFHGGIVECPNVQGDVIAALLLCIFQGVSVKCASDVTSAAAFINAKVVYIKSFDIRKNIGALFLL